MEEWIGGTPQDSLDERPLSCKKISEYVQKTFHKDMEFVNQDLIKMMIKATRGLKKADLIETRSKIEYEKYNTTSYPAFLWQEKEVASFYFFVSMLGYIDKKINREKQNIDFNSSFVWADKGKKDKPHVNSINESNNIISKYLFDREEILDGYKIIMDKENSHSEIILEVLKESPSYNKFEELYKEQEKHGTQLYINHHLINAYNIGYIFEGLDYNKIINKYRKLYNELYITKQSNKILIENQKDKCKKR